MTTDRDKIERDRNQLKSQFRGLFEQVEEILFRHDPVGIAFVDDENVADNPDEYAPEVEAILPRLKTAAAADEVTDIVYEEFLRFFDGEENVGPKGAYEALSQEIWMAWKRFGDAKPT
jgi:hypothetical protein